MLILHRSSLLLVTCALLASCASGEIPFEGPPAVTNPNNNPNNENNNTMEPPNTRPIAAQVPSGAARVGETITLDGSGSMDPDGDVLSFSWTLDARPTGSAARILDADQPIALLVPDLPGEYLVTLVVNDGKISSAATSARFTVTPAAVNRAPVADAGVNRQVATGTVVTLDGSGSMDPDGDTLTYAWSLTERPAGSNAALSSATSATPSFTPDREGRYEAQLIVRDGRINSAPASVVITAVAPPPNNRPPVARVGADQTVTVGQAVMLNGSTSSDPDNDPLTFMWSLTTRPQGSSAALSSNSSPTPSFTPDQPGTYRATLVVSDGKVTSNQVATTITAREPNRAPVADAGLDRSIVTGSQVQLDGRASSDPDSDTLTYLWTLSRPAGSSATLSSTTSAQPAFTADVDGLYTVTLVVNDGQLNSSPATVRVTASTPCLIFSEYIEGFNSNKAVEIFNCGQQAIDLSGFGICLSTKATSGNCTTNCSTNRISLSGTLAAGGVRTFCNSGIADVVKNAGHCNEFASIANFNGDDRLVIFRDVDSSGSFTPGDQILDAFGRYDECPADAPWARVVHRRCNFTPYRNMGAFNVSALYSTHSLLSANNNPNLADFAHLGVPPTAGTCN